MARDQLDRYREAVVDDDRGPELVKLVAKAEKTGLEDQPRRRPRLRRQDLARRGAGDLLAGRYVGVSR